MAERGDLGWALINGGRELCWFLAWAAFCTNQTLGGHYPFFPSLIAFTLAVLLTRLSLGRGWFVVQVILVELAGFLAAALLLLHGLYFAEEPLFASRWLFTLLASLQGISAWASFLLQLLLILVLWWNGVALARRPKDYANACLRFDFGLAAFLALFLIKLAALVNGSTLLEEPLSLLFLYPFFLFALAGIGREQLRGDAIRDFLPAYRGIGVIISFVCLVLLAAGAVFLFFQPVLKATARIGYHAVTTALNPLLPVLLAVLRFMFGPRNQPSPPAAEPASSQIHWETLSQSKSWWLGTLEKVLGWGLLGFIFLGLAVGLLLFLYLILRWFFSRTAGQEIRQRPSVTVRQWWLVLREALVCLYRAFLHVLLGYPTAAGLYGALRGWGARSGLPPFHAETPREFALRLQVRFPTLRSRFAGIIDAYQQEVYEEKRLTGPVIAAANKDWRYLRSPRRWPARLKICFRPAALGTVLEHQTEEEPATQKTQSMPKPND
ncbi:MAG: DUF4129 domain-containing protein [Syntrophaceae bacterium]|nr:DUF4129 domain-containing protein [Syntrophaceae bacterium]